MPIFHGELPHVEAAHLKVQWRRGIAADFSMGASPSDDASRITRKVANKLKAEGAA
jgi:hypothetical protein